MEEFSEVTWLVGYREWVITPVGTQEPVKSDQSVWKVFGCSRMEGPATDNATYMIQPFPCHTQYSPRVVEAILNTVLSGPCKPLSITYAVKCLYIEASS